MSSNKRQKTGDLLLSSNQFAAESVLMSSDILPLVLDFIPRNEMRGVALVCRFFMTVVASHLEPVLLTFKNTRYGVAEYVPFLFLQKTKTWRQAAASRRFQNTLEWTEMNGFYYAFECSNLVRYDPIDDAWTELPSSPSERRQEFGFTSLESNLFLVGGKYVPPNANVECYNVESSLWELCPPTLTPRICCSASTLDGFIYVVAGSNFENATKLAKVERWRPGNISWEAVASLNRARSSSVVCTVDDRLYVFGGLSESSTVDDPFIPETSCEMYCPVTNKWTLIAAMPTIRFKFSLMVVGQCVFCVGGSIHSGRDSYDYGETTNIVEIYDTETNTWSTGEDIPEQVANGAGASEE